MKLIYPNTITYNGIRINIYYFNDYIAIACPEIIKTAWIKKSDEVSKALNVTCREIDNILFYRALKKGDRI